MGRHLGMRQAMPAFETRPLNAARGDAVIHAVQTNTRQTMVAERSVSLSLTPQPGPSDPARHPMDGARRSLITTTVA